MEAKEMPFINFYDTFIWAINNNCMDDSVQVAVCAFLWSRTYCSFSVHRSFSEGLSELSKSNFSVIFLSLTAKRETLNVAVSEVK